MFTEKFNEENEDSIWVSLWDLKNEMLKQANAMSFEEKEPWEFNFLKKITDQQNRNWKVYSYTLLNWWNDRWIENVYQDKMWQYDQFLLPGRNFCDQYGNIVSEAGNEWWVYQNYRKWETVYIRVPDREVVDNVPEMTIDEIKKLSDDDVRKVFASYEQFAGSDDSANRWSIYEHADKNWDYVMFNGKKVYVQYRFWDSPILKENTPFLLLGFHNGWLEELQIWIYDWVDFDWISCYSSNEWESIERWVMKMDDIWPWFNS